MLKFAYYLASTDESIDDGHPLWRRPLPVRRQADPPRSPDSTHTITYQDYFDAVSRFCLADEGNLIRQAAARRLARTVNRAELSDISIFLEKHGAFYHPARLLVGVAGQTLSFVVNVAVSSQGQAALPREIAALAWLNEARPFGWVPEVYGSTVMPLSGGGNLSMFLGNWFEEYHEFHLTHPVAGEQKMAIVVWDGASAPGMLSDGQFADLYREAAMILTACYDPVTTTHIFPWHHAAGDFVVRPEGDRLSVRLITVRDLVPIIDGVAATLGEATILEALTLFFLHLSLRIRLDRLDGVGAVVWAPDEGLAPMIAGFFQGLDLTARLSGFPEAFPPFFRDYFNRRTDRDLLRMARQIAEATYRRASEERPIIDHHLKHHVETLRCLMAKSTDAIVSAGQRNP